MLRTYAASRVTMVIELKLKEFSWLHILRRFYGSAHSVAYKTGLSDVDITHHLSGDPVHRCTACAKRYRAHLALGPTCIVFICDARSIDWETSMHASGRGWKFWLIIIALCVSEFLSALDLVCLYTLSTTTMC